ncbi:MAG: tRNA 2-thiouridine(34) synthase MnmA [Clostridiales bacterium]|nr:tRNA 2-thiouridine(34) synthase MnmA [Clostridiales bacterium]
MSEKALIAMSGGVDSSVAALLTKQLGYSCVGATMKLFDSAQDSQSGAKSCCTADDALDAKAVAIKLGMPHYVFNYKADFEKYVIKKFVETYEKGATPNPCIDCNRYLKFGALMRRAAELSADYVVTGHYAKIVYDESSGRYLLKKAADLSKDQSYVLYTLSQKQLAHTLFPLGGYTKPEIRQIAEKAGFVNAKKHESQDICFVPAGRYADFIESWAKKKYPPGSFVAKDGSVLGTHSGIIRYTKGQRRGLGVSGGERLYVISKDIQKNTVTLGKNEDLYSPFAVLDDINLISCAGISAPLSVEAKTGYNMKAQPAVVTPLGDSRLKLTFAVPQRAVTPGQAAVFYAGDTVVGGGVIV